MRLRFAPASPFARKVRVALLETGLHDSVTFEDGAAPPLTPNADTVEVNPLGKIPCLVTDEGLTLYDSRVITRWIAAQRPEAGLYPEGDALWEALVLEATADGIMEAGLSVVYEGRARPEEMRFAPWVETQEARVLRTLDRLEIDAEGRLAGRTDMGALSIACALGYVEFRLGHLTWRDGRPKLAAWEAEMLTRPSLAATVPG